VIPPPFLEKTRRFGIKKDLSGMRGPLGGAYPVMKKPLPKEEALYA
jgi:hypothetical protein